MHGYQGLTTIYRHILATQDEIGEVKYTSCSSVQYNSLSIIWSKRKESFTSNTKRWQQQSVYGLLLKSRKHQGRDCHKLHLSPMSTHPTTSMKTLMTKYLAVLPPSRPSWPGQSKHFSLSISVFIYNSMGDVGGLVV